MKNPSLLNPIFHQLAHLPRQNEQIEIVKETMNLLKKPKNDCKIQPEFCMENFRKENLEGDGAVVVNNFKNFLKPGPIGSL